MDDVTAVATIILTIVKFLNTEKNLYFFEQLQILL